MKVKIITFLTLALLLATPVALAELPTGYLVWSKGDTLDPASRKIYRMTLPDKTDIMALTSGLPGEDIECQVSPDGKWVAFAKAKLPGSNYHQTKMWKIYLVSIHGIGDGREEIKIDDNGYWPSWGADGKLYYSQVDEDGAGQHTRIIRVSLDDYGAILEKTEIFSTREKLSDIEDVNECFVSPDATWFAARTRGEESESGVGAFTFNSPAFMALARAGNVGCMPYIAPSGTWGIIAGRDYGIRWGDAPSVANRQQDQVLIEPFSDDDLCYHPGFATDEQWVLSAHSTESDHNSGPYDIYIYKLDDKTAGPAQLLAEGGFNGWPHVWVGEPTDPPIPSPHVDWFRPDSYTVIEGSPVELSWQTSFADLVTLDEQAVDPDGSQIVTPTATQIYSLSAASSQIADTHTAELEITVNATAQPVTIDSFSLEPENIVAGETARLSWSVSFPYTLEINERPVGPSGSMDVSPIHTTDYVLNVSGHQGPISQTATLTVEELKQGLDDRGGCMCQAAPTTGLGVVGLALLFIIRRRRIKS
jgi:MYXO-CTERM domain-containing protein